VELASNGRVAVEACAARTFDLVLMDMQMPEMEGVTATKLIRASSGPNQKAPVLALTANAFVEDAERCRAAGMDEHLTKPLRKAILVEALGRHLERRAEQWTHRFSGTRRENKNLERFDAPDIAHTALSKRPGAQKQPVLAAKAWDDLVEDFGVEGLRRLAATFEKQQGEDLAAMSMDDPAGLKRCAHSLKGSAKLFGAAALAAKAERLEAIALEAGANEIAALTAAIMADFADVCREIKLKLAA
jgi:CheY-like chemotaxis protein/HPt (histidine-containing phosphotransfer) domain-containing protein